MNMFHFIACFCICVYISCVHFRFGYTFGPPVFSPAMNPWNPQLQRALLQAPPLAQPGPAHFQPTAAAAQVLIALILL